MHRRLEHLQIMEVDMEDKWEELRNLVTRISLSTDMPSEEREPSAQEVIGLGGWESESSDNDKGIGSAYGCISHTGSASWIGLSGQVW